MKLGYEGHETVITDPDKFRIELFEIARSDRTASGKLVKDIVALKHRFLLEYEALDASDINVFISLYSSGKELSFIYDDCGQEKTAKVSIVEFPRDLFIYDWQYSENISIAFEEI